MTTAETLPPFDAPNVISLSAQKDSKILSISVYSGRAELTRLFTVAVKTGLNEVRIADLPNAIDQQSFKVEGRGPATIHDVALSNTEPPALPTTSARLISLLASLNQTTQSLARAEISLSALSSYLSTLDAEHTDPIQLQGILDAYEKTAEGLDDKVTHLEKEKKRLEKEVEEEKANLAGPKGNVKLGLKATIGVFADFEGEVEIAIIYAVSNATWAAQYDIRVSMDTKEKPVTLIYKGSITQSTGEDWADVPIQLETATPTFGVSIPELTPWTLSIYRPPIVKLNKAGGGTGHASRRNRRESSLVRPGGQFEDDYRRLGSEEEEAELAGEEGEANMSIKHRGLDVSSKGNVSATFSVPGLMSVPSDGVGHMVTIVKLELAATMEWVAVPKVQAKVHLKAKVENVSEYTLLPGPASVYVNGSFISRTTLPLVSPSESFSTPLGLDPTIRVTYLPLTKKATQSGFIMSRSSNTVFTRRIVLHNTKTDKVEGVRVLDQVPVSEDAIIAVKLVSPALSTPGSAASLAPPSSTLKLKTSSSSLSSSSSGPAQASSTAGSGHVMNKQGIRVPAPLPLAPGITAQWAGTDDLASEDDVAGLGGDGKVEWVCAVPAQGKVTLVLQWEVSAPLKTPIAGLEV